MCKQYVVNEEIKVRTADGKTYVELRCTRGCKQHRYMVRVKK